MDSDRHRALAVLPVAAFVLAVAGSSTLAGTPGEIRVRCEPGVRIYIDEVFRGEVAPGTQGIRIPGVEAGGHVLRGERAGYRGLHFQFRIREGQSREVDLTGRWIPHRPAPSEIGTASRGGTRVREFLRFSGPIVCKPIWRLRQAFTGAGVEIGIPLERRISLAGDLVFCADFPDNTDQYYMAANVGVRFEAEGRVVSGFFRPAFVVSYVDVWQFGFESKSLGAGLSLIAGPEVRFSPRGRVGFFFGLDLLLVPHAVYEYGWRRIDNRVSLHGGAHLILLF